MTATSPASAQAGAGSSAGTVTSGRAKLVRDWQATPGRQAFRQVISVMQRLFADSSRIQTGESALLRELKQEGLWLA